MRGFSLAEVILAGAISGIIGVLIISVFVQNNNYFREQSSQVSQGLSLNETIAVIKDSVRNSAFVAASYTNAGTLYSSSLYTLVLALPSYDANNNLIDTTYDYAVVTPDSTKPKVLRKLVFPNPLSSRKSENKVLNSNLDYIYFYYLDKNSNPIAPVSASAISVTLNVKDASNKKAIDSSASALINLKND